MEVRKTASVTITVIFILCFSALFGQTPSSPFLDSLKNLAFSSSSPREKVDAWYKAAESLQRSKPDHVLTLAQWMKAESEKDNYPMGLGMAFEQTGNAYYYKRKTDSSIMAYRMALKHYTQEKAERKIFTIYNYLMFSFRLAGIQDSTIFYVKKELEQAQITNDSADWATALHDDGFHLVERNQLNQAISTFFQALNYVKQDAYNTRINIYNGIGDCYHVMGNEKEALRYFHNSLQVAEDMEAPRSRKEYWLAQCYNRLASTYLELKDSIQALLAIRQQLLHASQTDDREQLYPARLNYGMYFTSTHQYDKALEQFKLALAIQKIVGRKRAIGIIHYNMAGAYNEKKDFKRGLGHADSAQNIFSALKSKIWESKNSHTMAKSYAGLGRYPEAYKIMDGYVDTNGELMAEDNNKKVANMQAAYETEKKERQISELELDKQKTSFELAQNKNQRYLFIAILLGLLVIIGLVYYQYRQKQNSNLLLTGKNQTIAKSLAERETLLKEIHHRVKNNLQIISSLLSLQSKNLTDEAAQSAVGESRNRVKSMSLIHEQLYQEDNLAGVSMPGYINHLVESLAASYGIDRDKIELAIESEAILLDVDSAIPIGLILNELVSNSLKYAFPADRHGKVMISLKQENEQLKLCVEDNGIGMDPIASKDKNSFGLSLVHSLMRKLKSEMDILNKNGTRIELRIKDFKIVSINA